MDAVHAVLAAAMKATGAAGGALPAVQHVMDDDPLASLKGRLAVTQGDYLAHRDRPENMGEVQRIISPAGTHLAVQGPVDRHGANADQRLAGPRAGRRDLLAASTSGPPCCRTLPPSSWPPSRRRRRHRGARGAFGLASRSRAHPECLPWPRLPAGPPLALGSAVSRLGPPVDAWPRGGSGAAARSPCGSGTRARSRPGRRRRSALPDTECGGGWARAGG